MELKSSKRSVQIIAVFQKASRQIMRSFRSLFLYTALILLAYTALLTYLAKHVYETGSLNEIKGLVTTNVNLLPHMVRGFLARPEHITIDIKHENYLRLSYQREIALKNQILISSPEDYVPAKIRYKDSVLDVKLRLKGDLSDHWAGQKWSFRISVKGDNTLFGMKEFSIQHPKTRMYLYEWLYHEVLRRAGLPSLRYEFVDVTINGRNTGIYALEEHFDRRLIEYNRLREGPIVRFNEDLMWREFSQQTHRNIWDRRLINGSGSYYSSDIDAFQTTQWLSDPEKYKQFLAAKNLLEGFRQGHLKTSEVFDVFKLAKYFALSDLFGSDHAAVNWTNARFYYNPVSGLLEPIGFDAFDREIVPIDSLLGSPKSRNDPEVNNYFSRFFDDLEFYSEYIRALNTVSQESYLRDLFDELNDDLERNLSIIYSEFPGFSFSREVIYDNQRFMQLALDPAKGLRAYYGKHLGREIELKLGNLQLFPVEVLGLAGSEPLVTESLQESVLLGKGIFDPVRFSSVHFTFKQESGWPDQEMAGLMVHYRILGTKKVRSESISRWPHYSPESAEAHLARKQPNADRFDFLLVDPANRQIFIKPGSWNLDKDLIVPAGYRFVSGEKTHLNLVRSAMILSYSPLEFIGSEEHPIIIQSSDSTGQGLAVLNSSQPSILQHVIFDKLSNPSQGDWKLTGAVTFYESPVTMRNCKFIDNQSEDALNILRTRFTLDGVSFIRPLSDALDSDFASGKILNSHFLSSGNDAIDLSGSSVLVENVKVQGAGDKGLSVGENSQVTANNIDIRDSRTAVASKDLSKLAIHNLNITHCQFGLTAYQKKSEFGSASIQVTGLEMSNVITPYLVEYKSSIDLDGTIISGTQENVQTQVDSEEGNGTTD